MTFYVEEDIAGLEIAVDQAALVSKCHCPCDVRHESSGLLVKARLARIRQLSQHGRLFATPNLLHPLVEAASNEVRHHQIRSTCKRTVGEHGGNARMI